MEEFEYSWIYDERHGWTLMKEDFDIPVIDAPLIFKDTMQEVCPSDLEKLKTGHYVVHDNKPTLVTEKNTNDNIITLQINAREKPHEWELSEDDQKRTVDVTQNEDYQYTCQLRVNLNVHLKDGEILKNQCYVDINENQSKNLKAIKTSLEDLSPVITEVCYEDTNLGELDKECFWFRNSQFSQDMELDVLCMTINDVQHVKLFKEVMFKTQEFSWNSIQCQEDVKIVGFGLMGAYRRINQTGGAMCTMKVSNDRSKQEEAVDVLVRQTDFDIHSFFFDKSITLEKGDPLRMLPENPIGSLYEITADCQEYCGSDGTVFNLSVAKNCIAVQYYI